MKLGAKRQHTSKACFAIGRLGVRGSGRRKDEDAPVRLLTRTPESEPTHGSLIAREKEIALNTQLMNHPASQSPAGRAEAGRVACFHTALERRMFGSALSIPLTGNNLHHPARCIQAEKLTARSVRSPRFLTRRRDKSRPRSQKRPLAQSGRASPRARPDSSTL